MKAISVNSCRHALVLPTLATNTSSEGNSLYRPSDADNNCSALSSQSEIRYSDTLVCNLLQLIVCCYVGCIHSTELFLCVSVFMCGCRQSQIRTVASVFCVIALAATEQAVAKIIELR